MLNEIMDIIGYVIDKIISGISPAIDAVISLFIGPVYTSDNVFDNQAKAMARASIRSHEGKRLDVYTDSTGFLTVGIGHKVTVADGLQNGQTITDEQAENFFNTDLNIAFSAGQSQAAETRYNPTFIAALTEVNFQLGTGWRNKFPSTWAALKTGDYQTAINKLLTSAWAQQTPVRVASFVNAINQTYS